MSRATLMILAVLVFAPQCRPADGQDLASMTLEQLMQVNVGTAALHPQTLHDAPASVTVVTAEDIRKYGYRTLGEALASVRGFYMSNDRSYQTMGVRGFSLPGDYSSHVLVMVNGHNMADNDFDYMLYFGNDFPIDMNLIKQIEIIRGPSSALYGSNAIFATINIITKSPTEAGPITLTADTGSFGEKKTQIVETGSLGAAKFLFSGSVFNNSGESPLYFPEYNAPQTDNGMAINMNTERGFHFFSTISWGNWTVTAAAGGPDMIQPISWGPSIFNNRGSQNADNRDFVDAVYSHRVAGGELNWRTYYDSFHYQGRAEYALEDGVVEDNRTNILGNWVGSAVTYGSRPFVIGDITVGLDTKFDLRNLQESFDVSPVPVQYLLTNHPEQSLALFMQDEKQLSERWKLDVGLRFDKSSFGTNFLSPRAALIYQRSEWTYKFLYGRGFRDPSAFQLFYSDGFAAQANPNARPESADTVEVDAERRLGKRLNLQVSAYGYRLRDFLVGIALPDGLIQYQNAGNIEAVGVEVEINGRPTDWLEVSGSYAVQQAQNDAGRLVNSPSNLAKLRFAVPLGRKFDLSGGMQYDSSRSTLQANTLKPVYLADFTLTSKRLLQNFDFRVGLRNAFNLKYSDPIALSPIVDSMPQPGRSYFVELVAHRARN